MLAELHVLLPVGEARAQPAGSASVDAELDWFLRRSKRTSSLMVSKAAEMFKGALQIQDRSPQSRPVVCQSQTHSDATGHNATQADQYGGSVVVSSRRMTMPIG